MPLKIRFRHTSPVLWSIHRGSRGGGVSASAFEDRNLKRFTETTKWSDPWFRRLSERAKLLWGYLTDNCNAIGLIDLDFESASFHIGGKVEEKHLAELGDRVQRLQNGKIFIPKFIPFQYGELSATCPAHNPVFRLLSLHQLTRTEIGYQYPSTRVLDMEEERKRTGKEEGVQGEKPRIRDSTCIPEPLSSSAEFLDVWSRWISHLKQKRKPATLHAQDLQLAKLMNMGVPKAIETLKHCMERNWQGIYEKVPEHSNNGKPLTMYELQAKLKVKQERATALKNKHCSTVAMGDVWDGETSKAEWVGIRKEIKILNQQVENYAPH